MGKNQGALLGVIIVVAGCVAMPVARYEPEAYQFHKTLGGRFEDLVLHWNLHREAGQAIADGYVDTSRAGPGLVVLLREMRLVGLDGDGRVVSRSRAFLPAGHILRVGEQARFQAALPLTGTEATIDIEVDYNWTYPRFEDKQRFHLLRQVDP